MPIYDFQCTSCGHKGELMRKMSEPNTSACPQCGAEAFTKLLSAPSFQLNGTGWYATDFKSKANQNGTATSGTTTEAPATTAEAAPAACATGCACH